MRYHAKKLAILLLAASLPISGPVFAQASVGGPAKQTAIGGPAKSTSLVPSQKRTTTAPPTAQNACANCGKKTKK